MNITNAQYIQTESFKNNDFVTINDSIKATIDDVEMFVPLVEGNRYYDEIMRQVAEGTLTIADAE